MMEAVCSGLQEVSHPVGWQVELVSREGMVE